MSMLDGRRREAMSKLGIRLSDCFFTSHPLSVLLPKLAPNDYKSVLMASTNALYALFTILTSQQFSPFRNSKVSFVGLTTYPDQHGIQLYALYSFAKDPLFHGPVISLRRSGSYFIYRSLAIGMGTLCPSHRPD
ncbi:hypothetical protein D9758_014632 [Tetrapyrgos nigripes]|uniref:GTP cyclohydrolase N-terminal domain-containing protein n=1 Tax=Tetrapyrgos nigripes TaxID=182062 RepID=A0A8H5CY14_9AGAR|nr:hypothetical protein D9758_014632 [Tetrapyrgos nigripes]